MVKKKIKSDDKVLNSVMDSWNNVMFPYLDERLNKIEKEQEKTRQEVYELRRDVAPQIKDYEKRITKLEVLTDTT